MSFAQRISDYLHSIEKQGLLRSRTIREQALRFDSNDYLSLAADTEVRRGYSQGFEKYPSGSGASMVLSGYHPNHRALERAFAELLAVDDCLLFSSGFSANLAVTALLKQIKAHCLIDKSIHASVYDGLKLSAVPFSRYKHNDIDEIAQKILNYPDNSLILTEGIFSMSGQISPLDTLTQFSRPIIVDEAHSFGVLGKQGLGAVNHYQLSQQEIPLRVIPLGKAMAGQGAIVAGQSAWIEALTQAGRSFIYSTAHSPAMSYGLLKALEIVVNADARRQKLTGLIKVFKEHVNCSPLQWRDSETAIQQLQLGCPLKAMHYDDELKKLGISCSALRVPTVSVKDTGLRVILNYHHQEEDIQQLFKALHQIYDYKLR